MTSVHLTSKQIIIGITVATACFLPPFISSATGLISSEIINYFGYDASFGVGLFSWIFTLNTLISTVFLIPASRLADKFNKKIFFTIGVFLIGISSLGTGFSSSLEIFLVMRALQGVGNALMFGTAISLLVSVVDRSIRGTMIGIAMTGICLGNLLAPLLTGFIENVMGWSWVYIILCPVALVSFILSIIFIPKDKPVDMNKFDWIGSLIFIFGMSITIYGFSELPDILAIIFLIAGMLLLLLFFVYERRNSNPLIRIDTITHNRVFSCNCGANFFYFCAIFSMETLISVYMAEMWGIDDSFLRALIISTKGLILAFFTMISGRFYDRMLPKSIWLVGVILAFGGILGVVFMGEAHVNALWLTGAVIFSSIAAFGIGSLFLGIVDRRIKQISHRFSLCLGLGIIIVGLAVFLLSGKDMNIWLLILVETFLGLGIALFVTPNSTEIMNSVSEKESSFASGFLYTMRMFGMSLSFGIIAILESLFISSATITETYLSEFLAMFHCAVCVSIGILILAFILSWCAYSSKKLI